MVAVNPFFGFSDQHFHSTAKLFNSLSDVKLYMPLSFYNDNILSGKILNEDIQQAIEHLNHSGMDVNQLLFELHLLLSDTSQKSNRIFKTITEMADDLSGFNFKETILESVSNWASMHFNEVDKSWRSHFSKTAVFQSWKAYAEIDMTPEVAGISEFRSIVRKLPEHPKDALTKISEMLDLESSFMETYLIALAYTLPGWSSYISGIDWENNLYGEPSTCMEEFLIIMLSMEYIALSTLNNSSLLSTWREQLVNWTTSSVSQPTTDTLELQSILQTAFDLSNQRELIQRFNQVSREPKKFELPKVQAVFCIDVRSEVYRRHLEVTNSGIQTLGFAGFFGFPVKYMQTGTTITQNQCPVLLPSGPKVTEKMEPLKFLNAKISKEPFIQMKQLIRGFRKSPISSFGYVSPLGLYYLPKLLKASFKGSATSMLISKSSQTKELNRTVDLTDIHFDDKVNMAFNALKGMGLQSNFASLIIFVGHGSSGINNPHKAGLACGACGGNSGDVNALTAAKILNDNEVRAHLKKRGVVIPKQTTFLAALHDTATDQITLLNTADVPLEKQEELNELITSLNQASLNTRIERSFRFTELDPEQSYQIMNRNMDWGQTRPEWGLARCSAFVIASRDKTKEIDLSGASFLHDYDYSKDIDLSVLEGIMTAPMVVTSWINLQYYASTVDQKHFGAGNKTLHNVVSGIGTLEGSSGDLRIGLPLQSVHNGQRLEHLPFRLNVIIDAPTEAINQILSKHPEVKQLFDNQWIKLLQINQSGKIAQRYISNLEWNRI